MRVGWLSDTHGAHHRIKIPEVDLLLHAGDFTKHGQRAETINFLDWFAQQPGRKVFVAGNHDHFAERFPDEFLQLVEQRQLIYLQDQGTIIDGLSIWGSPVTPAWRSTAFERARGEELRNHWVQIPERLDILLTHTPPFGIGDRAIFGKSVGCEDLRSIVQQRSPRFHGFGHIHEGFGEYRIPNCSTVFLNVASKSLWLTTRDLVVTNI